MRGSNEQSERPSDFIYDFEPGLLIGLGNPIKGWGLWLRGLRLAARGLLGRQGHLLINLHKNSAIFSLVFNFFESHIFQFSVNE